MASSDSIGVELGGPEAPIKKAPVAKKAKAKAGNNGGDDFNFKFGFSFQSPAKTIRWVS